MQKIYSKKSFNQPENKEPKAETVKFLLDYSKALKVTVYKNLEFETLLN
ncbi:hypothetical protein ACFFU1_07720 [Algibacter miyuki]|uniref:Uncharacterized protein n=1 Tax=Algibacter miyuki TaxID=1306933 RepID=A0ABV5GYS4_9FLAO|nr:hypothetical protein [Algibacter miyuki]MDN3667020.1 hypothetical protein [Algibacter miyuki]